MLLWFFGHQDWLTIDLKKSALYRFGKWFVFLIPLIPAIFFAFWKDSGYIINLVLFPAIMIIVVMVLYSNLGGSKSSTGKTPKEKNKRLLNLIASFGIMLLVLGCIVVGIFFHSKNYNPFSSDRLIERSVAYFDFSTIQEFGYRLSEERAQFFAIQTKYTYPSDYDCYEPMHSGISSFTDPVIENDLSVPFGLIYQFGKKWWCLPIAFLLIIWGVLGFAVLKMSLIPPFKSKNNFKHYYFSTYGIIRIFCMSLILSSGLWLLCSYYGVVPFTGRLIYGLGQDSIGEVFEIVFLFAFMGLCGNASDNEYTIQKK
jgi:hypothetical protein